MTLSSEIIDIPAVSKPSPEARRRFRQFVRSSQHRWAKRNAQRSKNLPRRVSNSWTSRRTVSSETPVLINC